MLTGLPSKRISPLSKPWIPAMHLIRVDFPAPLSPTSAITSPFRTSKSPSERACTEPNDLEMPRSWRIGVPFTVARFLPQSRWRRPVGRLHLGATGSLLAVLLVHPDTDVGLLQEPVLEEPRVVRLGDRDYRQGDRRFLLAAVLAEPVDARHLLAPEQGDGRRGGRFGLVGNELVDGHRLPARDDVLHTLTRRVLSRQRDRLQVLRLQSGDHGAGDVVVRRDGSVDLVVRLEQHLREDRRSVGGQPEGHELLRALGQCLVLEQRVQNSVVPALEPERVLVGWPAPELGDDRLRLALQSLDDALGLGGADGLTVESHVDLRDAADHLTVVVDRRPACRCELLLDRDRRALGDVGHDGHLRPGRQARIGLRDHLLRIVQRVRDRVGHSGGLQGLGEVRRVKLHPADRRLGVRKQDADLDVRGLLGCCAGSHRDGYTGDGDGEKNPRRLPSNSLHCTLLAGGLRDSITNRESVQVNSARISSVSGPMRYATASRFPFSLERTTASQTSAARYPSSKVAPWGATSVSPAIAARMWCNSWTKVSPQPRMWPGGHQYSENG